MFAKRNGSISFRSNKRSNYKKNINPYSNYKPRTKGNISQLYEKYHKLAKESSSSGDRIQAEYYFQFADHYSRLMAELGLKSFNNENILESAGEKTSRSEEQINKEKNISLNENEKNKSENILEKSTDSSDSIETVSFIAKPAKKISSRTKKEVS